MRPCFLLEPLEPRLTLSAGFIAADGIPGGAVTLNLGHQLNYPSFAFQPDGGIILADSEYTNDCSGCGYIVRFNSDGSRDLTFGDKGVARVPYYHDIDNLLSKPDGKFLAFSWSAIYQFNSDGHPDTSFMPAHFGADSHIGDAAIAPDGGLILAGQDWSNAIELPSGDLASHLALYRLNGDGTRDRSFGNRGIIQRQYAAPFAWAGYSVVAPDGKILVDAFDYLDEDDLKPATLLRFNPDGTPDQSFATNGRFHFSAGEHDGPILLQPDGKIIQILNGDSGLSMLRLLPDGTLDTSFGEHGRARYSWDASEESDRWEWAFLQPDGKILAVSEGNVVARLNPDGTLDSTFAFGGAMRVVSPDPRFDLWSESATLRPDGHLLLSFTKVSLGGKHNLDLISEHLLDISTDDAASSLDRSADGNFLLLEEHLQPSPPISTSTDQAALPEIADSNPASSNDPFDVSWVAESQSTDDTPNSQDSIWNDSDDPFADNPQAEPWLP